MGDAKENRKSNWSAIGEYAATTPPVNIFNYFSIIVFTISMANNIK